MEALNQRTSWLAAAILMFLIASYCHLTGDPVGVFTTGRFVSGDPERAAFAYFIAGIFGLLVWWLKE